MQNKSLKDLKLGIAGVGMVGGALRNYFEKIRAVQPLLYDPGKNLGSLEELNQADVVFVCVPTPFVPGKGFDLAYVEDVCGKITGEKIVVIKSTVVPGSTQKLQEKYLQHKFLFNPEFLTELTTEQDMNYPDRQIIGYTKQSFNVAKDIMLLLPLAPFERLMPSTEAELVKYFGNNWFAVKVIYANQVYDLCQKLGVDYDTIKEAGAADKRIGRSHLEVIHRGYRGYGGKCLSGDEIVFEVNGSGLKTTRIRDFYGKKLLSMRDGQIIVDEVLAKSEREVDKTIKFNFSKGRSLEVSPDHLMVVWDRENGLIEREAKDVRLTDKIPVMLGHLPLQETVFQMDFFQFFSDKESVFTEEVNKSYVQALRPYLTFHQYKGFRRERAISLPVQAVVEAGIGLSGLKIKTGKTGTWVPNVIQLDKDFARLFGYYLAEGCCSDERVHLSFGIHEKEIIEDMERILMKLGIKHSAQVGNWKGHASNYTFKISSRILTEYFEQFGSNCYEKQIPSYLFSSSQEIKDNLLAGLLRGDGSIVKSNMGNYYTASYATVSRHLIEGIDLLLREKGILASRKDFRAKKSTTTCYQLLISEQEAVKKVLPLLTEEKRKDIVISERTIQSPAYERLNESIAILEMKKIETLKEKKKVYALETKTGYYLTSGGVLTHNCLPKDIRAIIEFADKQGVDLKLHKVTEALNNELMKEQGIEDPEKFSKRE